MAQVVQFPKRAADVLRDPLALLPTHAVDDWGRDPQLVRALSPLLRLRCLLKPAFAVYSAVLAAFIALGVFVLLILLGAGFAAAMIWPD